MCYWYERHDTGTAPAAIEHYNIGKERRRGDLIEVYKILTGKKNMDSTRVFQFASRDLNSRGHHLK